MIEPTRSFRIRALAGLAAIAVIGAACGGSTTTASPGTSAPATQPATSGEPSMPVDSPSGEDLTGQSVTVIGTWGGTEQEAFLAMVKPWEERTGATVKFTGTRDLNTVLTTGVASGVLPDLAGLPGPAQMNEWVDSLVDLSGVLDAATYTSETAAPLVELGTVNGKLVGVFIKTAVKGLIWYNPKTIDLSGGAPATWTDLQSVITQNKDKAQAGWCVGVESGAASGWPGTDWIEDIVLRQAGPDVYNQWWQGQVKWTFEVGGDPMFATPPGCLFHHQASFITGLGAFKTAAAGTDYDFFPFPDIDPQYTGAVEGAGDLFGMFHDTPAARSLMAYLVTAEAQDIWVKIGGALSANKNALSYPDDISKRSAEALQNAKIFVFDASDLMPTAMNSAFWAGIVKFVKDPGQLDSILAELDATQADAYGG